MKRVITYGNFDLFHIGHTRLLKRARQLGDELYVAVSSDEFSLKQKNKRCIIPYPHRAEIVESCKYVDIVVPETNWDQKINDILAYEIDIFVIGDDWKGKFDFLNRYTEVVYLPRTQDISTSYLKQDPDLQTHLKIW